MYNNLCVDLSTSEEFCANLNLDKYPFHRKNASPKGLYVWHIINLLSKWNIYIKHIYVLVNKI